MKRLPVHVAVESLQASIHFYAELFAAEPTVLKCDYAKWMLEDPRVNFAISQRSAQTGVQHLGIQVEDRSELEEVYSRLKRAHRPVRKEGTTTCCYAKSEKRWSEDPQGVQWETFLTTGESMVYADGPPSSAALTEPASSPESASSACRAPSCCTPQKVA